MHWGGLNVKRDYSPWSHLLVFQSDYAKRSEIAAKSFLPTNYVTEKLTFAGFLSIRPGPGATTRPYRLIISSLMMKNWTRKMRRCTNWPNESRLTITANRTSKKITSYDIFLRSRKFITIKKAIICEDFHLKIAKKLHLHYNFHILRLLT